MTLLRTQVIIIAKLAYQGLFQARTTPRMHSLIKTDMPTCTVIGRDSRHGIQFSVQRLRCNQMALPDAPITCTLIACTWLDGIGTRQAGFERIDPAPFDKDLGISRVGEEAFDETSSDLRSDDVVSYT